MEAEKDDLEYEIDEKREEVEQLQEIADYYDNMSDTDFAEEYITGNYGSIADMIALGYDISNDFDYRAYGKYMERSGYINVFKFDNTYYVAEGN